MCTVLVSCPKVLSAPTSLATSTSQPLRTNFSCARSRTLCLPSPVSAAKPTITGAVADPLEATSSARMSGLRTSWIVGADWSPSPGQLEPWQAGLHPGQEVAAHGEDLLGLRQPSRTGVGPGQSPRSRVDHECAAQAQGW